MNHQWKPIESAPKDGTEIIAFHPEAGVCAAFCPGEGFAWHCMDGMNTVVGRKSGQSIPVMTSFLKPPTHWMALPAAPGTPPASAQDTKPDDTAVICPGCAHQFRAIPVQIQALLTRAGYKPPFLDASAQDDAKDEHAADACPRCDGSGEITVMSDNSPDAHDVVVCCDHCQGSGAAVDAAKYLAAALSGEKYRHMQLWAEYRNFHRSLCARFGYGHDKIHFRRDLVSLEEAIAAKVAAPAAGDARDAERYRGLRAALTTMDTTWIDQVGNALEAMGLDPDDDVLPTPEQVDAAFDAALSASQQQEG